MMALYDYLDPKGRKKNYQLSRKDVASNAKK